MNRGDAPSKTNQPTPVLSPEAAIDVLNALLAIREATLSHIDGRDLLKELHPRKTLDIKRRVDGVETWFEGDWLSNVWDAVRAADFVLKAHEIPRADRGGLRAWVGAVNRTALHVEHPEIVASIERHATSTGNWHANPETERAP